MQCRHAGLGAHGDGRAVRPRERRGVTEDEVWAERAAEYPAGRVIAPEEIAETIAFLASDGASGISGETITVALGSPW